MVEDDLSDSPPSGVVDALAFMRDTFLRSYSQILFSRSLAVGAILLLATAMQPRIGLTGFAAVLLAAAIARIFRFSDDSIRLGLFGYNALLVGLGAAALLPPGPMFIGLTGVAVLAAVLAASAFQAALGTVFNLPTLTLPFLVVFYLLLGAAPLVGQDLAFSTTPGLIPEGTLPESLRQYLRSLGSIFFLPRVDIGFVVLAALLVYSRIAFLLSLLGYAIAHFVGATLLNVSVGFLPLIIGYNFILVAIAIGGVWFVPSLASFLLATAGTLVSGLVTVGLLSLLAPSGIPLLILPFNATLLLMLYAMRQRVEDQNPKSVDFVPGAPEQNLNYFRTRLARFGARHWIRFRAPFLGTWICTQGVNGEISHRGPWRHAFDFEVADEAGRTFSGTGDTLEDYLCFGMPVLAVADGQVARTSDGVANNALGALNLRQNWGNFVILEHAPGLFSMVAHLAPGSLVVRQGQLVQTGDELGRCGNSGRSAVPHIHFQLQRTARAGDATIASELHEIVLTGEDEDRLRATLVPEKGQRLRGIARNEDVVARLTFPYREPLVFRIEQDGRRHREVLIPDIDIGGNFMLRSSTRRARLFYEQSEDVFIIHDTVGSRASMLHLIHAAVPRVPYELSPKLSWTDHLPRHRFVPWVIQPLLDLVSPFLPGEGLKMSYHARWNGSMLEIEGQSTRAGGISTLAAFSAARGLERVETSFGKQRTIALRLDSEEAAESSPDSSG